jgi:alkylation response protein AidB-like acyl-CoA dehydrogenase
MYNLHLSAEQLEFRDTVRDFVTQEIKPVALKPERLEPFEHPLLTEILDKASQMGLRTMALSEDKGGAGADHLTGAIVTEELAVGDVDVAAVLAETSTLSHILFDRLLTPAQRARLLPQFLKDDRYHLAFADREPSTDTRLGVNYRSAAMQMPVATKAVRAENGDWIVNGSKDCVRNAPIAKLFAVQVTSDGAGRQDILLVPRDAPGLAVREQDQAKLRCHGVGGELVFSNCRVPAENLLSAEGGRAATLFREIVERGSPQEQGLNLGIGRAAYEAALEYAQLRVQGGRRIIEHQAIGTKLAEIAISLEVARNAVWQAAYASDHPDAVADRSLSDLPLQIIAKVFTSEAVYRAAKDAAEVFGAMGVMRDMPLQKYVHDALVCLHSGDGNSDAKLRIAEALAGYRRP